LQGLALQQQKSSKKRFFHNGCLKGAEAGEDRCERRVFIPRRFASPRTPSCGGEGPFHDVGVQQVQTHVPRRGPKPKRHGCPAKGVNVQCLLSGRALGLSLFLPLVLGVGASPPFAVRADLFDSDAPRWNAYARTNLGSNTFLLLARIASGSAEKTSSFVVLGLDALPYRFVFALRYRSRTFGL